MRFWVYDKKSKRVSGPSFPRSFKNLAWFGPDTKVAPEGASSKQEWKRADSFPELTALLKEKAEAAAKAPQEQGEDAPP